MIFEPTTYRVLLVSSSEKLNSSAAQWLSPSRYFPVHTARSVAAARQKLMEADYDLLLINAPLPDDFGLALAEDVCAQSESAVLLIVRRELAEEVDAEAVRFGILTLPKPTNPQALSQALHVLSAMRERLRQAGKKQQSVQEKIKELRLIDRAKWALIGEYQMSEPEAHRYIEKRAMDSGKNRKQIAEEILEQSGKGQ